MRGLGAAVAVVLAGAVAGPAGATSVRFQPEQSAVGGAPVASTVDIRLVDRPDARGVELRGLRTTSKASVRSSYRVDLAAEDAALVLDLVPQSEIARVCGAASCPTWYRITRGGDGVPTRVSYVQVPPESGVVLEEYDLIGATAVPPGDLTGARLLPGSAADGQTVVFSAAAGAWLATSGRPAVAAPATPGSPCTAGAWAWDATYLYRCVATNTWVRQVAERTW